MNHQSPTDKAIDDVTRIIASISEPSTLKRVADALNKRMQEIVEEKMALIDANESMAESKLEKERQPISTRLEEVKRALKVLQDAVAESPEEDKPVFEKLKEEKRKKAAKLAAKLELLETEWRGQAADFKKQRERQKQSLQLFSTPKVERLTAELVRAKKELLTVRKGLPRLQDEEEEDEDEEDENEAVSYTHLTLPTICSV